MDPRLLAPLLTAALVIWAIYRRMRRSFGRQQVIAGRMGLRIGVLSLAGALVLVSAVHEARTALALLAGIACGAALGCVGLRYTRFEVTEKGRFYTPHTYIGLIVTALFLGRLLYRLLAMYAGAHGFGGPQAYAGPPAHAGPYGYPAGYAYQNPYAYQRSPLTLAIFGGLVGYYVLYYLGVLHRTRRLAAAALESRAR